MSIISRISFSQSSSHHSIEVCAPNSNNPRAEKVRSSSSEGASPMSSRVFWDLESMMSSYDCDLVVNAPLLDYL